MLYVSRIRLICDAEIGFSLSSGFAKQVADQGSLSAKLSIMAENEQLFPTLETAAFFVSMEEKT
jgi:hypothetical protein